MKKTTEALQREARDLLKEKRVDYIIGYGQGRTLYGTVPLFIKKEEEVDDLVWNPFCITSLPTYLFLNRFQGLTRPEEKRIGLVVKGCDSKGLLRILNDRLIKREDLVIMGLPCMGMVDPEKFAAKIKEKRWTAIHVKEDRVIVEGKEKEMEFQREDLLYKKCLTCKTPTPAIYDSLLGEAISSQVSKEEYMDVKKIEAMSIEDKRDFWNQHFERCIRCYACRNVCPACNCKSCIFQEENPVWTGKGVDGVENMVFHFTRAFHVAGRCIDCGECERVCPVEIPLHLLNQKIQKDIEELFHVEHLSREEDLDQKPPLGFFLEDDHEEFL